LFGGINLNLNTEIETWRFADLPLPAEGEGEGEPETFHSADSNQNNILSLHELLRGIQLYNLGEFHCDASTEDGYAPGSGDQTCAPHSSDYDPQDWNISLNELLRLIQLYNAFELDYCPNVIPSTEDGFCAAPAFENCYPMP
jgi:hypothetical protein